MSNEMNKPLYGILMGMLATISCLGHVVIATALRKRPELRKKHFFLLSLGLSDMVISIHAFMSTAAAFSSEWPFGDVLCQLDAFFGMSATFFSISSISWIAKMKYYRECETGKYINRKFQNRMECFYAGIAGLMPFFGFGEYGYETDILQYRTGCLLTFRNVGVKYWIYLILITVCWFVAPLYSILTSYNKISKANKKTCWLQYIVPMQMILSFTPYALFAFASAVFKINLLSGFYVALNNVAAKIMIATNPIIYIWSEPDVHTACQNLCTVCSIQKEPDAKKD